MSSIVNRFTVDCEPMSMGVHYLFVNRMVKNGLSTEPRKFDI